LHPGAIEESVVVKELEATEDLLWAPFGEGDKVRGPQKPVCGNRTHEIEIPGREV
jgi:hypothetical protein